MKTISRSTGEISFFRCHVIGPRDAGKSTFCQGFLGRSLQDIEGINNEDLPLHVVNTVQIYGQEKYLVLQDIDVKSLTDMLSPIELHCDVICLVYDISNPKSFEFVARIFLVSSFAKLWEIESIHYLLFVFYSDTLAVIPKFQC